MERTIRRLGLGDEPVLAVITCEAPDFDLAGRTSSETALTPRDAAEYLGFRRGDDDEQGVLMLQSVALGD